MDTERLNKFMMNFLPILLQQKLERQKQAGLVQTEQEKARIWLEKQLKEYEAWEGVQTRTGEQSAVNQMLENMANPEFFKGRTYPELEITKFIQEIYPEAFKQRLGLNVPRDLGSRLTGANDAIRNMVIKLQNQEPLTSEELAPVVQALGYKPVMETVQEALGQKAGAAERGVREKEILKELAGHGVREKEIGIRREELEYEKKGGKKKSEETKKLEKLDDERQRQAELYYNVGIGPERMLRDEKKKIVKANILDLTDQIKKLKDKLEIEPEEKYKEIAEALESRQFTKKNLLEDMNLVKGLSDQGYVVWKILEYMKK